MLTSVMSTCYLRVGHPAVHAPSSCAREVTARTCGTIGKACQPPPCVSDQRSVTDDLRTPWGREDEAAELLYQGWAMSHALGSDWMPGPTSTAGAPVSGSCLDLRCPCDPDVHRWPCASSRVPALPSVRWAVERRSGPRPCTEPRRAPAPAPPVYKTSGGGAFAKAADLRKRLGLTARASASRAIPVRLHWSISVSTSTRWSMTTAAWPTARSTRTRPP